MRALAGRILWPSESPERGRDRSDIGEGYRSYPEGRHVIFYIRQANAIAIIGVPHQSMDVLRYFDP
jgi:toxin ParE1/3/4